MYVYIYIYIYIYMYVYIYIYLVERDDYAALWTSFLLLGLFSSIHNKNTKIQIFLPFSDVLKF